MGYYTSYRLKVHAPSAQTMSNDEIVEKLRTCHHSEVSLLLESLRNQQPTFETIIADFRKSNETAEICLTRQGKTLEPSTWYSHQEELREFSHKYPTVLFELYGIGEEGEMWVEYHINGRMQKSVGTVTYEAFDVNKLDEYY